MDERALAELFRDAADSAAQGAPPPTFDHADVLAGSQRARIRQRQRVIGGTAAAAAVLAAVGLGGASLLGPSPASDSTLAGAKPDAPNARSIVPYMDAPEARSDSAPEAVPFGAEPRKRADSCARVDDELFRLLGEALPEVRGLNPRPLPVSACPPNGRGFEVDVNDNGIQGSLQVILSPRPSNQINVQVPPGGGVVTTGTPTDDGGWLTLNSLSIKPGRVPFKDLLRQIVSDMADEL